METLSVLIIGCGNIAGGYDQFMPEEALPLGHAKAFLKHGGFALKACVEPDSVKRLAFQQRWHVPNGFTSLQDKDLQVGKYDVISICSPTNSHTEDLKTALALKPKLIFCEKPITSSLYSTQLAVKTCDDNQVLLAVNYTRRWSPQVAHLKSELDGGHWGEIRSVSAVYNKGILNNGSHMLDLFLCLFGPLRVTSVGKAVEDFFADDPTVDASLLTERGVTIQLNVAHAKDYALFEMQIVTEKGVISMEDGGARWRLRRPNSSEKLAGYSFLNTGEWLEPEGSFAMTAAVNNIFNALQRGSPLASTGNNALQAQVLCEQIKKMALKKINNKFLRTRFYEY